MINFSAVFVRYFNSIRKLKYYDVPEYDVLVDDFERAIKEKYKVYDYIFDWTSKEDYERNKAKYYGNNAAAPKKATTFMDVFRGELVRLAKLVLTGDEDVLFLKNMSDALIDAVGKKLHSAQIF
ncbi:hypothetical protein DdX_22458 [Ditylenchus destructor]|uniref:Uncharacterized protein n=1 Tax=Ditylenchus destructor TaxID=166010 RepID=A0AAD4MFQ9_9BILA|nr:hypothetical protein DdX_22458 [Ditylenchus destructor]